ncbi:MAG: hypothetical protein O3A53_02930 [Acidobacteria bacterium]|nr:hypothetical protein [Acidobacteriota bacterium]MDA1233735.1 hypothetical protein [Acidobacteriota bacterium]
MLQIVEDYRESDQPWPASKQAIGKWAIDSGKWAPHPSAIVSQCADDIARAMREEYVTDPQGRRVRAKHAARVEMDASR